MPKTEPMFDDDDLEEFEPKKDQPPSLEKVLTRVASGFMNKHFNRINWAKRIPRQPIEIAKWWQSIDKPPHPFDNCKKKTNSKTQRSSWHCPHIDQSKFRLGLFLNQEPEFQDVIIDANLNGCYWVGHEPDEFKSMIDEHVKMLELGVIEYRKQALAAMRKMRLRA